MNNEKIKKIKRDRRRAKIRAKIKGASACPRLSIFRSNQSMFVQIIDDSQGKTLVSAHSREVKKKKGEKGKVPASFELGKIIAQKALAKKIKIVVFDRGGYKYHGRVKAVAEGARTGGLKF